MPCGVTDVGYRKIIHHIRQPFRLPPSPQGEGFFTVYPLPVRLSTKHTPAFFRIEFLSKEGWTWLSNSRFPTG